MEHGEKASWVGYVANLESVDVPFATCVVLNANFLLTSSIPRRIHTTKELVVSKLIFLIFIGKFCFTKRQFSAVSIFLLKHFSGVKQYYSKGCTTIFIQKRQFSAVSISLLKHFS